MPDAVPGSVPTPQRSLTLVTSTTQPPTGGSQTGIKMCSVCSRLVSSAEIVSSNTALNLVCVACSQVTGTMPTPAISSYDAPFDGVHQAIDRSIPERSSEPVSRVTLPRVGPQDQKGDPNKVSDNTVPSANATQNAMVPIIAMPNGRNRQINFPSLDSASSSSLETTSVQAGTNDEPMSPTVHLNSPVPNKMFIPLAKGQVQPTPTSIGSPSNPVASYHREMQSLLDPFPSLGNARVSSSGYECLYPGAQFIGMQTNRDKEYRVKVKIVDVDPVHSTLSGFLTIDDLTDQHPEITTYFDGQIIGQRFGFITHDWGATELVDRAHWSQFTPYQHLHQSELQKPYLTFRGDSRNKGYIFMRWKERFLVPDHRIRDVYGASYAGFYYVCLEFGSLAQSLHGEALPSHTRSSRRDASVGSTGTSTRARRNSSRHSITEDLSPHPTPATGMNRIRRGSRAESGRIRRLSIYSAGAGNYSGSNNAHHHHEEAIDLNEALAMEPPVQEEDRTDEGHDGETHRENHTDHGSTRKWLGPAKLTGYYYHSDKVVCDLRGRLDILHRYQRLELHHVPERTRGSFEFR